MQTAGKIAALALVALALTVLPSGDGTLNVVFALLTIVLYTVIAIAAYRGFRQYRFELESLSERQRLVLYGSLGLVALTFCATTRMFDAGGVGVLAWLALLGACAYGLYWVWTQYRSYA